MTIALNVYEFLKNRISKSAPFWPKKHFPPLLPQLLKVKYNYHCILLLLTLLLDYNIISITITITIIPCLV